jgi:predicted AAA+ superfamily ATPase
MMKRKQTAELENWKQTWNGRYAMLLDGARRVGKSYLAEDFARKHYDAYAVIDFSKASSRLKSLFHDYLGDLDTFFLLLQAELGKTLPPGRSLLIFDEVQFFPRAREAIKHLVADGRYHYLETGSLVSLREKVKDILIPSEEMHLEVHPMDFEEFLSALEQEALWEALRAFHQTQREVPQPLHRRAMDLFRQYLVVGGMPQAVEEFIQRRQFDTVDQVKRSILRLYRDDIRKHANGLALKVESIFDELPAQLQRHEKKYRLNDLAPEARFRDYENAFLWLQDAMVVNPCFNASEPTLGLRANSDRRTLKCYMEDTGLLLSHALDESAAQTAEIHRRVLFDRLEWNAGMLVENAVAQMLRASGHSLYFYSAASTTAADRMEIDFLIAKRRLTAKHNITPVEVKSGRSYSLASLQKYRAKYGQFIDTPIVLHDGMPMEKDGVRFLPLYMAPFL